MGCSEVTNVASQSMAMEKYIRQGTLADNLLLTVINVTPTPWMLRFVT